MNQPSTRCLLLLTPRRWVAAQAWPVRPPRNMGLCRPGGLPAGLSRLFERARRTRAEVGIDHGIKGH